MELPRNLRVLHRGVRLATQVVASRLGPVLPAAPHPAPIPIPSRLVGFEGFGDNPGKLRMLAHLPGFGRGRPLVVVLHGCGQDAAAFARDSGWMALADRLGFPLILPQQAEANNASRCFQWFHTCDITRDQGEAGSIAAMVRAAIDRFDSDPGRIFVVGLSAGGAMAAALLAAYPDLFAAGAAVAGLPVGSARSGMQALLRMAAGGMDQRPEDWALRVKRNAPPGFSGAWPRLSVWQGQADDTVAPGNAMVLADQWRALHGLATAPMVEQVGNDITHRFWPSGEKKVLEVWSLPNLPHAYPIGDRAVAKGRFVESAGVDATPLIAGFFGLD